MPEHHPTSPDLSAGAVFPDLRLTDHAGNDRSLSELVAGDPTVLHFYRGWWCPKEQRFFDVLRRPSEKIVQAVGGPIAEAPAMALKAPATEAPRP